MVVVGGLPEVLWLYCIFLKETCFGRSGKCLVNCEAFVVTAELSS